MFFCSLGIVKPIECTNQIAGDSPNPFKANITAVFCSAALRAAIADNACKATARVTVNWMVHRAITNPCFFHAANDLLKRCYVLDWVAVHFYIADMSAVCKGVIRSFQTNLVHCPNRIVNRNME